MDALAGHAGSWTGTNDFRLMPDDPLHEAPSSARVSPAARGDLVEIAYVWSHAEDGEQEGLLVLGAGDGPDAVLAFWGDSWHQHPSPRVLDGAIQDGTIVVGYAYSGDWRWEILVDATNPEALTITMNNVIPESAASEKLAAGAYAAMRATLVRRG